MCVSMCVYVYVSVCVCVCVSSPRVGVAGACELSSLDAGDLIQILCKSSTHSQPLGYLFSHRSFLLDFMYVNVHVCHVRSEART